MNVVLVGCGGSDNAPIGTSSTGSGASSSSNAGASSTSTGGQGGEGGGVIGDGGPGPITQRLKSLYFDQVHGRGQGHPDWVTLVDG